MENLLGPRGLTVDIPSLESLDPSLVKGLMVFGVVFFLALLIGFSRHYLISSNIKGIWSGFIAGIIVLLLLEAGIFFGVKKYVLGEQAQVLPDNIRIVLNESTGNLNKVLGIEAERVPPTAQSVVSDFELLSPLDVELVQNSICRVEE